MKKVNKRNRTVTVIDDVNEHGTRRVFGKRYEQVLNSVSVYGKDESTLLFLTRYRDYTDAEFEGFKQAVMHLYPRNNIVIFRENPDGLPF